MKAPGFDYVDARSIGDAVAAFRNCSGEARYLAGGQSLLATLNLRLSSPDLLIDLGNIAGLRGIEQRDDEIRIGALTCHADILSSALIAAQVPLLASAAPFVAHPAIRNKGTIGGSLALADPAAEFPAIALTLGARIELSDGERRRFVDADDFFLDLYETAMQPGEILAAIWFPVKRPTQRFSFDELARRRGDYAIVGAAVAADFEADIIKDIRIALISVGPTPMRARQAEDSLRGHALGEQSITAAQHALAQDLSPDDDPQVSSTTRMHLARVLLKRRLIAIRTPAAATSPAP